MPAYIQHICTQTPAFTYSQTYIRDCLKGWATDPKTKRLIHAVYGRSGIETRHSVSGDFVKGAAATLYKCSPEGTFISPSTGARNAIYAEASRTLAVDLARKTLDEAVGFSKDDISHIIFASCTGFVNPGPDYHIIRELGLPHTVERYTLGFMGCYAAFPALRMAAQFCEANPDAVVLVMCLELCTLHMQNSAQADNILANSLFADGAAAAIVSARRPERDQSAYRVQAFASSLVTSGQADMAWNIGDEGFNLVLSSYVPEIIGTNLRPLLEGVFQREQLAFTDFAEWAVHPGGRAILDKVESSLGLASDTLEASRQVLRDYGNMSSATILFVLKELLDSAESERATTCAMSFGPGLTVETAVLERMGCTVTRPASARAAEHLAKA